MGGGEVGFRDKPFLWGPRATERDENQFTGHLAFAVLGKAGLGSSIRNATFISEIICFFSTSGTKADIRDTKAWDPLLGSFHPRHLLTLLNDARRAALLHQTLKMGGLSSQRAHLTQSVIHHEG